MIARQHRFHGPNSLRFAYKQGKTLRDQYLVIRFIRNPRRPMYRVAVIVSRKVHKSAVQRNRLRRRLYESIRLSDGRLLEPYDVVITVLSDQAVLLPTKELEAHLMALLQKANVLAGESVTEADQRAIVKSSEVQK